MKVEGTPKPQSSEARRFSAAKASPKAGGKSFGDALKKAAAVPAALPEASVAAIPVVDNPNFAPDLPGSTEPGLPESGKPAAAQSADASQAADPASFENHMEMVKLRLKAGYYSGSNIDEALSEKLTGYFDELA